MEEVIVKQEYYEAPEQVQVVKFEQEASVYTPEHNVQIVQLEDGQYTYIIENQQEEIEYEISNQDQNRDQYIIEEYDGNYEDNGKIHYETVYVETESPQEEEIYTISEEIDEVVGEQTVVAEEDENVLEEEESLGEDLKNVELLYECSICNKTYKTPTGVNRHINVAHSENFDKDKELNKDKDELQFSLCPCCGEPSDSAHTTGDFSCDQCNKLFILKNSLDRHICIEHPVGQNYKCYECKKLFPTKELMIDHTKVHSLKSVKCGDCGREFSRKFHLERHIGQTGCMGVPKQVYECRVCHKTFTRKDNLAEHLKGHAGIITKPKKNFYCEFCSKEFPSMALLQIHVRTHTGERPYGCDICDMKFPSSGAMKKHRRTHTGEKPYTCPKCNKKFAAKETLNRHWRTHTGEKPHECKFCGKSFIQAAQLRAHIFHHTGENAYECPYCTRAFNRKLRLTTHIKFIHEGAERLACPQEGCTKTFFRREDIQRHLMTHSNEKPHKCDICFKSFTIKSSLRIHKNTHRKEPPVTCEVCNKVFLRKDCLMRHMRTKHRDVVEEVVANVEKKRLQSQLLQAVSDKNNKESIKETIVWNELTLTESIRELLELLVDEECLGEFGHPVSPVDKVLESVIRRCGHNPASEINCDYLTKMRENAKLLFTVVIDDTSVKDLLSKNTVDEVIMHVLKLARRQAATGATMDQEGEEVDIKYGNHELEVVDDPNIMLYDEHNEGTVEYLIEEEN